MNAKKIRQIAKILKAEGLDEIEFQNGDVYLRLKRSPGALSDTVTEASIQLADPGLDEQIPKEVVEGDVILSPLSGTFYRSKSPGTPPYVNMGEDVAKGTILCILEAMKLMNELEAQFDCKIVDILVEDGQTVTEGEALFRVLSK